MFLCVEQNGKTDKKRIFPKSYLHIYSDAVIIQLYHLIFKYLLSLLSDSIIEDEAVDLWIRRVFADNEARKKDMEKIKVTWSIKSIREK